MRISARERGKLGRSIFRLRRAYLSLATCLSLACGGRTVASHGTDADWSPVCPAEQPSIGAPCGAKNIECQYGTDPRADCNRILVCGVGGNWSLASPANECAPPPNPGECPAEWHAVARGAECSKDVNCYYPQGTCVCRKDGGARAFAWSCSDPSPTSCTVPPPRIGSSCAASSDVCTYRPCVFAMSCQSGAWQEAPPSCR